MRYIQGGADFEQVDFTNVEIKNLTSTVVDLSESSEGPTQSYIFPKEKLKGKFLFRASGLDANKLEFLCKLQEKQNGAWVDIPKGPIIIFSDGSTHSLDFQIGNFKEIRAYYNLSDLTGDAGTNATAPTFIVDLLV